MRAKLSSLFQSRSIDILPPKEGHTVTCLCIATEKKDKDFVNIQVLYSIFLRRLYLKTEENRTMQASHGTSGGLFQNFIKKHVECASLEMGINFPRMLN
jgi:hypothetical protein